MLQSKKNIGHKSPVRRITEIKIAPNRVRAYRGIYQKQQDKELKHKQYLEYKKETAKLKWLVPKTKRSTWKKYCEEATNTYRPRFKIAANKTTKPSRSVNILRSNERHQLEKPWNWLSHDGYSIRFNLVVIRKQSC